jgi:hypothetical protein
VKQSFKPGVFYPVLRALFTLHGSRLTCIMILAEYLPTLQVIRQYL